VGHPLPPPGRIRQRGAQGHESAGAKASRASPAAPLFGNPAAPVHAVPRNVWCNANAIGRGQFRDDIAGAIAGRGLDEGHFLDFALADLDMLVAQAAAGRARCAQSCRRTCCSW
jgi:hypothetical protein